MTISDISPKYKVKGTAFRNAINYFNHHFGDNSFEKDSELINILGSKTVLPSSWLPASKFIELEEKLAEKFEMNLREFCVECTTYILTTDLNGIYRFFIKVGGPERIMASAPRMSKIYNNLFSYHIILNGSGLHKCKISLPILVYDWAAGSVEGGLRGILNVCKKPMKTFDELEKRDYREGNEDMMEVIFELTY